MLLLLVPIWLQLLLVLTSSENERQLERNMPPNDLDDDFLAAFERQLVVPLETSYSSLNRQTGPHGPSGRNNTPTPSTDSVDDFLSKLESHLYSNSPDEKEDAINDECSRRNSCFNPTDFFNAATGGSHSSRQLSGTRFAERNCFCDKLCNLYNDCCLDANIAANTENEIKATITCDNFNEVDRQYSIYFVKSCPKRFNDEFLKVNCLKFMTEKGLHRTPVSRQDDGLLFANIYCALCNGVRNTTFWNASFICPLSAEGQDEAETVNADVTKLSSKCDIIYRHDLFKPRFCKPKQSTCDKPKKAKERSHRENCLTQPTAFVYALDSIIYRNKYCALCRGVSENTLTCEDPMIYPELATQQEASHGPVASFSILLDINSAGIGPDEQSSVGIAGGQSKTDLMKQKKRCNEHEIFDPFSKVCRPLSCTNNYVFDIQLQECVKKITNHVISNTTISLMATTRSSVTLNVTNQVKEDEVTDNINDLQVQQSSFNQLHCASVFKLNSSEFKILSNGSLHHLVAGVLFSADEFTLIGDEAYVCNIYEWERNYTTERNETRYLLLFRFGVGEGILTFIGLTMSLVAMATLIIIYSCKETLRNLPGKIVLCLVSSLFVAYFLFLIGNSRTENYMVCFSCAVTMHFAFLASFFWMNIMAIDLFRTFSSDSSYKTNNDNKRFLKYSFYAWFLPIVIVTSAVLIDVFEMGGDFRPHYARKYEYGDVSHQVCWLTSRYGLMIWFAVPLALIMGMNIVLYIVTIRNIYVISKMTRPAVAEKPNKGQFVLFIKLSFIMGLTWLFGFLAAIFNITILYYLFVAFNSLQGLIVAAVFLCTKRVYRLLKPSTHHQKHNGYLKGSQSSSENTRRSYIPITNKNSFIRETTI